MALPCPLLSVRDSMELELGDCESPDGGAGDHFRSCERASTLNPRAVSPAPPNLPPCWLVCLLAEVVWARALLAGRQHLADHSAFNTELAASWSSWGSFSSALGFISLPHSILRAYTPGSIAYHLASDFKTNLKMGVSNLAWIMCLRKGCRLSGFLRA